ncbi:cytochrome c oxidase, subunit VA/VI [Polychytrium aggregatum]|uniref:cytochrome c oxidase, subunit VA/VI n=1 Tax=Polychytrium aggregatum TaxID=110093 RepID=UPI0022FE22CA|nr:cytochrome c oxidase, subunit VA/VI [Polychytrium aggregatum]KAI9193144.1 cytochrome c oxidase, subunit VA/VI [Polychytrium aggregatum]
MFARLAVRRAVAAPLARAAFARPAQFVATRGYASHELDPQNQKDYDGYVQKWVSHFSTCEDDFELERGLNHIFAADWVPSVDVITESLKAARRLNSYATAVRVLEALEGKVESKSQYSQYISELKPLLAELGVEEKKDLGAFKIVREFRWFNE